MGPAVQGRRRSPLRLEEGREESVVRGAAEGDRDEGQKAEGELKLERARQAPPLAAKFLLREAICRERYRHSFGHARRFCAARDGPLRHCLRSRSAAASLAGVPRLPRLASRALLRAT